MKSSECTASTSEVVALALSSGAPATGDRGSSSAKTNSGCSDEPGDAFASGVAAADGSLKCSLFLVSALLLEVEVAEGLAGVRDCCVDVVAPDLAKMRKHRCRCSRIEQSWMKGRRLKTESMLVGHAFIQTANRRQSVICTMREEHV
jgi:hypothetical protein